MSPRNGFAAIVLAACFHSLSACAPQQTPSGAAAVPTHILTLEKAGSVIAAQQGDRIEVRLETKPYGAWRLTQQSGDGRIEPFGDQSGAFRFRAIGIGRLELTFGFYAPPDAPKPRQAATFIIEIR